MSNSYPRYNQLNNLIQNNYNIAQTYYNQKKVQFKNQLMKTYKATLDEFTVEIYKTAKSFKPNVIDQVAELLKNGTSLQNTLNQKPQNIYEISQQNIISKVINSAHPWKTLRFKAGLEFEHFLADNINITDSQGNKILAHFGMVGNKSFTTTKASDTRSDLVTNILGNIKDSKVELEYALDIEGLSKTYKKDENQIISKIFSIIQQENITDLFGFQVKTYENLNDNKWMTSEKFRNLINTEEFKVGEEKRKTWSSNYAVLYPVYFLSKYIINILNPVNIAIIYSGGIMYTDDFLSKYRFYMEVTYEIKEEQRTNKRGGGYEVFPRIASNAILMYNIGKGSNKLVAEKEGQLMRQSDYAGESNKIRVAKLTVIK